jgi:hypothetical protein
MGVVLMPTKTLKPVLIEWVDTCRPSEVTWRGHEDVQEFAASENMACTTVGVLIAKTKDSVTVASTVSEDGAADQLTKIPVGCIKKIYTLRAGKGGK